MSAPWDLLVVGAGTAGIVSAETAASFVAPVLLVERERAGGEHVQSAIRAIAPVDSPAAVEAGE